MSQFKTQAEIYKALLDGKTLIRKKPHTIIKLEEGFLCYLDENKQWQQSIESSHLAWGMHITSWSILPEKPKPFVHEDTAGTTVLHDSVFLVKGFSLPPEFAGHEVTITVAVKE